MIANEDVVLEVPVGTDRTLVALLIAERTLKSGRTVLYLTDETDLALAHAKALPGLSALKYHSGGQNSLSDLVAYHNAQTLGIADFPTYFNTSPKVEPAEVVVFQSRETASEFIGSLFTLRVDRRLQRRAYDRICELVLGLGPVHSAVERMLQDGAGAAVVPTLLEERLWAVIADDAAQALTAELQSEEARFIWPRLQPLLSKCQVLVGPGAIEIRPPHELIRSLPGYRHAAQRVHLTSPLAETHGEAGGSKDEHRSALPDFDRIRPSASIRSAISYLRENYADSDVTLGRVARTVYMSQYHFSRSFKEQTGWRFIDFVTTLRLTQAQQLLRETATSITDISRTVGYRELSHFQRTFKKRFGMSASSYRARFQERDAGGVPAP